MTDPMPTPDPSIAQAAREWIMRLASGEISEAELAAYRAWAEDPRNAEVFRHELALWRSLDAVGHELAPANPSLLDMPRRGRFRAIHAASAVAACIALYLAGPELVLRARADHRTGVAIQSVMLPDGSRAVLDAGSAIDVRFSAEERRIELLRGRAWFEVAHRGGAPFRVAANGALVEDIGTAFAVRETDGGGDVAVSEGRVRVRSDQAASWVSLAAGQRARWAGGGVEREGDVPVARIAPWREGDLLLENAPIRTAIEEVARYRSSATFIVGDIDRLAPVTAVIRAARPDEGLDALAATARLQILRLPGGIAIVRPAD